MLIGNHLGVVLDKDGLIVLVECVEGHTIRVKVL